MLNRVALAAIASIGVMAFPSSLLAQVGQAELLVRIDRLENEIRQLTGQIEQMQYRNQQLEAAVNELRSGEPGNRGGSRVVNPPPGAVPPNQPSTYGGRRSDAFDPMENSNAPGAGRMAGSYPPQPPGGRRSDAFDPAQSPNAPGAPRLLGSVPPQPPPAMPPRRGTGTESTPYGDSAPPYGDSGYGRTPTGAPPRNLGSTPPSYPLPQAGDGRMAVATAPPSSSPRELLDVGTGYLKRREYALAEETFREFLNRYPSDRQAVEAQFGLGESFFQRQSYHDAANAFVELSKTYETSAKAPDALLRLGQSLAAMNERELACVAFGDVGRKYPRAGASVRQAVERELKRARC